MSSIDITVSPDLTAMFQLPSCATVGLKPSSPITVSLPGGATLTSFSDLSKGVPSDCAMVFSMLMQVAPFMASIECLVKVLKLVNTVVEILKGITSPFDILSAIPKVIEAAEPVLECALSYTPLELIPFVRDLLCLILKVLQCFLSQMQSLLTILEEISPQIEAATASGNNDLLAVLNCAQSDVMMQAQYLTTSLDALSVVLELAGDFMQIVGQSPITLPTAGSVVDVASLQQVIDTFSEFVLILQDVVNALGGCDS